MTGVPSTGTTKACPTHNIAPSMWDTLGRSFGLDYAASSVTIWQPSNGCSATPKAVSKAQCAREFSPAWNGPILRRPYESPRVRGESVAIGGGIEHRLDRGRTVGRHSNNVAQSLGRAGPIERGVAVVEETAVGRTEPVPTSIRHWRHPDDRLIEVDVAGRAVEHRITLGEDPAVRSDQPVAPAVGRRRHAHDRLVEMDRTGRAIELGVADEKMPPSDATSQ